MWNHALSFSVLFVTRMQLTLNKSQEIIKSCMLCFSCKSLGETSLLCMLCRSLLLTERILQVLHSAARELRAIKVREASIRINCVFWCICSNSLKLCKGSTVNMQLCMYTD